MIGSWFNTLYTKKKKDCNGKLFNKQLLLTNIIYKEDQSIHLLMYWKIKWYKPKEYHLHTDKSVVTRKAICQLLQESPWETKCSRILIISLAKNCLHGLQIYQYGVQFTKSNRSTINQFAWLCCTWCSKPVHTNPASASATNISKDPFKKKNSMYIGVMVRLACIHWPPH